MFNKGILLLLSILLSIFLFSVHLFACDSEGKTGFIPDNKLKISVWDKSSNGMTENRFLSIIKSVTDAYNPLIKSKGVTITVNHLWTDDTVNANAARVSSSNWVINMYGGLARHPEITDDAFAMVMCHELGHHIGGAPIKSVSNWSSSEGQADYFAAMKCLKRVFESSDNIAIVSRALADPEINSKCALVYHSSNEIALCQRIALAGKSLGALLSSLTKKKLNYLNPDRSIVSATLDGHPAPQCRLDTFFQGVLCNKSYDQDVSTTDPIVGTCIALDGYKMGVRPTCWYRPGENEI